MPPNDLTPFAFEERMVRVRLDEQGEPWFVAKDVCLVLELGNPTEALRGLEDDERGSLRITEGTSPAGGNPNVNVISESGLYALIFRSRKPEAKRFRRWVTREVLPALRRTGRYALADPAASAVAPPVAAGAFPLDLPEDARRLRPAVRAQVLACAVQAAKMENTGAEAIEGHFLRYCQLVAQGLRPVAAPAGVPPLRADEWRAVDRFAAEMLASAPGMVMRARTLYKAFLCWWRGAAPTTPVPTQHVFGQALARHYPKRKTGGEVRYHDVAMRHAG